MSQPPSRSILKLILTNFINSLRPRQIRGNHIGTDYMGTKYFEIPANPSIGKRKASRWFEPIGNEENFDQEIPAEWEAWLRGRRIAAPTEEEIAKNVAIMQLKKVNAAQLESQYKKDTDIQLLPKQESGMRSFPKRDDFELIPGKDPKEHKF